MLERCSQMTMAAMMAQYTVLNTMIGRFAPQAIRLMRVPTGYKAAMMMLPRDTMRVMATSIRKMTSSAAQTSG